MLLAIALFAYAVVRSAWFSDDAYITFRTIDNFLGGYGLRWNVIERVQTYTHPLWLLLLSASIFATQDLRFYYTPMVLSIGLSLAAVALMAFRLSASRRSALLGVVALLFSKAFVDYSTSGLENPLTHLLLAIFFIDFFRAHRSPQALLRLSLVAALGMLNRLDTALLFLPPLALAVQESQYPDRLRRAALGFLPLVLWECFSLVYYGFPLPNTAYAKLFSGTPELELLRQGAWYFASSWSLDPLTLAAIAAGLVLAIRARTKRELAVAAGVGLYLAYVMWIGGDFMSGRFLSAPLFAAVVLIVHAPIRGRALAIAAPAAVAIGLLSPFPPLLAQSTYGVSLHHELDSHGIADERQFYYPGTGLLSPQRTSSTPAHRYVRDALIDRNGPDVLVMDTMGMHGFFLGPRFHVIDMYGLCDPLTARLPTRRDRPWRIGHFLRAIPQGYEASARSARSAITDRRLAEFDDALRLITRGPLFSGARWKEIVEMNLGGDEHLIDRRRYEHPSATDAG